MDWWVPRGARRARRYVSVIIVGLLALAQLAGAASGVGAADPVTAQTAIARAETKLGPTAAQKQIAIAVSLAPLVTQQGMDDFLAQLADPRSPSYQHYLTPKEFTARFLDPAGRAAVADSLKSKGLTVRDTGVGSVINATGTVGQVERAFGVTLNDYTDASGRTFYANDRTPALPTAVAPRIKAVLGLDNAPAWHSHVAKPTNPTPHAVQPHNPAGCPGAVNAVSSIGFTPNQFATAFDFDSLYNAGFRGEGQTLALFELSDWLSGDSDTYKACFGSTTPVNRIAVDGGTAVDTNGQVEVNLDIDVMLGMLPKLAALNVYVSPNSGQGVVDQYQRMATDDSASVISTSWGICENFAGPTSGPGSVVAAENTIFFQMATQGQQIFAASGDDGSEDCFRSGLTLLNTDDPASQPYMVGVGGTTANINFQTNAYVGETVWNDGFGGGGGGGLSHNWVRPSWQTGPGVVNGFSNGTREVPDIAAPADPSTGYVVFSGGLGALGASDWNVIGGTSGAAPFTASGFALTNQALVARLGHRLGFTSPYLYKILTNNPGVLHDVTVGNNCVQATGPCATAGNVYPATAGYDLATGVGTPKVGAIANYLPSLFPNVSPAPRGPTSGGTAPSPPLPPPRSGGTATVTGTPAPRPPSR